MEKMNNPLWLLCQFLAIMIVVCARQHEEPVCTSRFDFEEKLLQKMVRLEHKMELLQDSVNKRLTDIEQEKKNILQETKDLLGEFKTEKDGAMASMQKAKSALEESLESFMDEKEASIYEKISEINGTLHKRGSAVLFSVINAQTSLVNGVVIFSKVLTNVGSSYDIKTGVFTSPYDGLYMFSFNVRSKNSGYCYCHILKNGTYQAYAISDGVNDMGSVNVYLHLSVGDKITLGQCGMWINIQYDGVVFSGQLVARQDSD